MKGIVCITHINSNLTVKLYEEILTFAGVVVVLATVFESQAVLVTEAHS